MYLGDLPKRLTLYVNVGEKFLKTWKIALFSFIRTQLLSHLGVRMALRILTRLAVFWQFRCRAFLHLSCGSPYVDPKPNVIIPICLTTDPLGTFFTNSQPAPKRTLLCIKGGNVILIFDLNADLNNELRQGFQHDPRKATCMFTCL